MKTLAVLVLALGLLGCGTPSANLPAPPRQTIAQAITAVDDADGLVVKTVIALRDSGKMSAATTRTVEDWCGKILSTDKQINLILASTAPWAQQKTQILTLLATVTAPSIITTIDPGAKPFTDSLVVAFGQLKAKVDGQ